MKKWKLLALSGIALVGATVPAYADFMIDPNPTGEKLFIDKANKDVNSFSGIVGSNVSGPIVDVATIGNVDTGSGFSNIKPVDGGLLTSLTFTPRDKTLFSDFGFRGQLLDSANGTVNVSVVDNNNNTETFTFTGLGSNKDFATVGIKAIAGTNETIQSVTLTSAFKEEKQNIFSVVPEPKTYAMLGFGVILLGIGMRRRNMM
jgi:hypothetical protein